MKCQHTSTVIQMPCNLELGFNRIYKTNLLWWLWKATEPVPTWAGICLFCGAPSLFKSLKKDLVSAYWVTHGFEARMLMIFIFVLRFDWIVLDQVWFFIWGNFCGWFLVAIIFSDKKSVLIFQNMKSTEKLKEKTKIECFLPPPEIKIVHVLVFTSFACFIFSICMCVCVHIFQNRSGIINYYLVTCSIHLTTQNEHFPKSLNILQNQFWCLGNSLPYK